VASASPSQVPILNIAAYKFAELTELPELRERLNTECRALELKGSILLSPEGINLFIAGERFSVEKLLVTLRSIPGLEALEEKRSESEGQPFNRMLVKIKQEIIAFGVEGINPARHTSPRLPAKELKRWLDEGRAITLLDTRNTYEVKLGTFAGAVTLPIRHFRKFPDAVKQIPEAMKEATVVSFCTGGIRCEKAAPFLEMAGFREVYQLEGGILKYFEECGGAHWNGECFVFDKRVGVDPALQETGSQLCFACQEPLTAEELKDPRYVYEVSCPYCYEEKS
jgi:predicted sulfurtransferase